MTLTKNQILEYVEDLNLKLWGPVLVEWDDNYKKVHLIVQQGSAKESREKITIDVNNNIKTGLISPEDSKTFLDNLVVTEYAQED
ncbi:MAG: hypothetical protein LBC17_00430 [Lactobacillaceae bacterium]|jgi:polyhydroxyalkanoate synthesis regulator phasin|nr:hypothetical protein [Lactobacillaceae bacterium]